MTPAADDDTHRIGIRIPNTMWPRVEKSAKAHDLSINEFMVVLIQKAFDHADRKAATRKAAALEDTTGDQP